MTVAVIYEFPAREYVCAPQGTVRRARIELDAPLGARRLLHAPGEERGATKAHEVMADHYPLLALPYDFALMYDSNCAGGSKQDF